MSSPVFVAPPTGSCEVTVGAVRGHRTALVYPEGAYATWHANTFDSTLSTGPPASSNLKLVLTFALLAGVQAFAQDPCAGCDDTLAQAYQVCAMEYGNPCAEVNEAGLVSTEPGTKKDVPCCMKKEKHDRCLECKTMDCEFNTCNTKDRKSVV